jgi:hypothetical protein
MKHPQCVTCPQCNIRPNVVRDFDSWFFLCGRCGKESIRYGKEVDCDKVKKFMSINKHR